MKDCVFCKIVSKKIPCEKVYEDKNTLAFLDINPNTEGHILLIPKKHFNNISELSIKDLDNLNKGVSKISKAILKASDGLNVFINNGNIAGQVVPHLHVHFLPRHNDDGVRFQYYNTDNVNLEGSKKFLKKIQKFLR